MKIKMPSWDGLPTEYYLIVWGGGGIPEDLFYSLTKLEEGWIMI